MSPDVLNPTVRSDESPVDLTTLRAFVEEEEEEEEEDEDDDEDDDFDGVVVLGLCRFFETGTASPTLPPPNIALVV